MAPDPGGARRLMRLGAFLFNLGNHVAAWRHPTTPPGGLMDLGFYRRLARTAERGCFDLLFHSDGLGINDAHDAVLRRTVTVRPEPIALLSALAAVTERIGLAATVSTTFNEPYAVARKLATLDWISGGRAALNVVTSSTWQEAANFGADVMPDHAARYRRAGEFVDVLRGLWDSWEDGAIVADQAEGTFADPARIHRLDHRGEFFRVRGPLNVPRPPQGHPVLIQAGVSADGQALAARVADVVFTVNASLDDARARYAAARAGLPGFGRAPDSLLVMPGLMPVVAPTEAEARARHAVLEDLVHPGIALAYLGDFLGHDLSAHPPDGPLPALPAAAGEVGRRRMIEALAADGLNLGAIARRMLLGRGHWTVVGSPAQVADEMQRWFEAPACDGFNILAPHHPGGLDDFVALVVPELRRRGLFRTAYEGVTLRDHLGLFRPPNRFAAPGQGTA